MQSLRRALFIRSKGFVLNSPMVAEFKLGDYFMVSDGQIVVLGNIYSDSFQLINEGEDVKNIDSTEGFKPSQRTWQLSEGTKWRYDSIKTLEDSASSGNRLTINLSGRTSFFFSAKEVQYHRINDFHKLNKRIIRTLSNQSFNFSRICLISEITIANQISYGTCNQENGELVFSIKEFFNGDFLELLNSDEPLKVDRVHGLDKLKIRWTSGQFAFQAKKLQLTLKGKEALRARILKNVNNQTLISNEANLLHCVSDNEINPSNVTEFFEWSDMTLEDIELLDS